MKHFKIHFLVIFPLILLTVGSLLSSQPSIASTELPKLAIGYIFTTHHTPLIVAMAKESDLASRGVWLKPIVPKEKYELIVQDKPLAIIETVVNKSGSETVTMFAQNRLDMALASVTAFMAGADKGIPIKVLCPTHVEGMGLVFPADSPVKGWDAILNYIKGSKTPVRIGYHSPDSAPRIVTEGALKLAGITVTDNPMESNAQVLLVDLKSTSNLIPALVSKQVDGWVGPAPFPEMAEVNKTGIIALDLRDLPPAGKWHNFPCCVFGARSETIERHGPIIRHFITLLTESAAWANANKTEVARITNEWMGTPVDAVLRSSIVYTTQPTDNWLKGIDMYLDILNKMNKLTDKLKGKSMGDIETILFDWTYVSAK